ncbi:MAG TPA: hypothetical protein VGO11_26505 [Chthoniobacteraceae bacterium]|jgi:hypothetical protein|nr:hypothetical protein [Chthoniobacteraceae bacterium]
MSITVAVENDTIKLPMHVTDGTLVEVVLPASLAGQSAPPTEQANTAVSELDPAKVSPAFAWMLEFAGTIDSLPEDFAEHHDDYLAGRRKR